MFRELFDAAPDAMIAIDKAGRIVGANRQAVELFGYAANELNDAAIETLIPERARAAHECHRAAFIDSPRVRPMGIGRELLGLKRNGDEFPVEIALSPLNTPNGQIFVASIRDVSETHRARQALARARYDEFVTQIGRLSTTAPNLGAAMEHIPELVADALSLTGIAILCATAHRKSLQVFAAFGLERKILDALGSVMPMLNTAARQTGVDNTVTVETCTLTSALIHLRVLAAAGFAHCISVPLVDGIGPAGMLVVPLHEPRHLDHDATHFLQSVANLLGAASQRIRMEEQLSHAQRLDAVGQLTGGVAHDFNNLLTVISGNLEILESRLADQPELRGVIGSALNAVGRGADLTRKLLAFARQQQLSPRTCNTHRLLHELGTMLKRTLGESVELSIACEEHVPAVYADPGQLEAALINLALNSRDAMPRGGRLSIAANKSSQGDARDDQKTTDECFVIFTVRDTGLGMPPEVLERAFEPFFTTKDGGKGSGLGLSMVYGFVKQSGGRIEVDSRLGYGTSINLHLPVARPDAKESGKSDTVVHLCGRETILVVEDEPDVRAIAVAFLRSAGYTVLATESAEKALALIVTEPSIGLVFSDVVLSSGMTGVDMAMEIGRKRPDLPVWLTSGYEGGAIDASNGTPGTLNLLSKPYRRQELLATVRKALNKTHDPLRFAQAARDSPAQRSP